jgi:hypothetical protein
MVVPRSIAQSLEGANQFFNGRNGQNRVLWARFGGEIVAGHGDVVDSARLDFDLALTNVSSQKRESVQLQRSAVEGMTRIGNRDLTLENLRVQRVFTLGVFSPRNGEQARTPIA